MAYATGTGGAREGSLDDPLVLNMWSALLHAETQDDPQKPKNDPTQDDPQKPKRPLFFNTWLDGLDGTGTHTHTQYTTGPLASPRPLANGPATP